MTSLLHAALSGKPLADWRIIDFHVHYGGWGPMHMPCTSDAMIAEMDRVGVEAICANAIMWPDIALGNREVAAFAKRHPGRVVGIAALNPAAGDMLAELKRCTFDYGFPGIKVHVAGLTHPYRAGADLREVGDWEAVWTFAADHHLPVLYHGIVTESDIKNFPDTTFVHAHGMCGIAGRRAKERLAAYTNLYVDTPFTQNTVTEALESVRIFGADRILWGTDAPLDDFAHRLGVILELPIPDEDKLKIFGGNARRVLALK